MFRVKICGITSVEDAQAAVAAGADAIGLNFYPGSPRYLQTATAEQIVAALPAGVVKVGVFVNAEPMEINSLADHLQLDLVQLHGDESPEFPAQLEGRVVMRALRLAGSSVAVDEYLSAARDAACEPRLLLVDAFARAAYGGTGQTAPWQTLVGWQAKTVGVPLILAGGLTPENVSEAIRLVRPHGVDTASGVELSPGKKSPRLVEAFVRAAKEALNAAG